MKRIVTSLLLVSLSLLAFSQQEPQFSHNMFNHMGYNPGYAGIDDAICATTLFRQQWIGFEDLDGNKGAPQTILFSLNGPVRFLHGGLGMSVTKDKLGFEDNITLKFGYSYHLYGLGPGVLGIGLQAGFVNKTIDFSQFQPLDASDPRLVSQAEVKDMMFDISFGAFYNMKDRWYAGIASTQLIQSEFTAPNGGNGEPLASPSLKRHYYISGGYNYPLDGSLEIRPSAFVKTDFTSFQFDINALAVYNNQFWAGVSYRNQDAIVVLAGANPFNSKGLESLKMGVAYDITTSALGANGRSSGTVEVMLNYCFKIVIPSVPTSHHTVRFL